MTATAATTGTSRWFRNAQLSLGTATVAGTGLLLVGDVDPVNEMISDAVQTVPGALLLMVAACGLASAGLWLLAGARRTLPRSPLLTTMLAVWCASLVAVAFFPTNLPGAEPGVAAVVHRVGAGLMAALPPLIALLVADLAGRRTPGEPGRVRLLRAAGLTSLAVCVAFGALHGPAVLAGTGVLPYAGLFERILMALVIVVAGLCAWVIADQERT
ncbi:DUF998 domain-containing protein [Actinoplanes sp. LDG1-06]|uniref:DUF998 domain-containing protein n=1 Tax=Paractinoplanes ovalisporus TaxID=2810368 RepID=A0ABS2A2I7_9ACTN|nr:DUF998 domain-containing protein [Actinoplanes ovalisporus]MBM2614040.1 DUF998 domain-containing protein [Actinoplanes ovalisporus]